MSHRRGFTLVELAIVLAIIAVLLGFAMSMGQNAISSAKRVQTQQRMKTLQEAMENFLKVNGYLPCPSSRALIPGNANFGIAQFSGTACIPSAPGIVQVSTPLGIGYIGAVPVRTLGLPDAFAGDGWDDKFTYAVSAPALVAGGYAASNTAKITIIYGDKNGTHNVVSDPATAGYGATYVIVSHGRDGKGAFPLNTTTVKITCNGNQTDVANCDDDLTFYDDEYNEGNNDIQYFDDFILWGSNTLARTAATIPALSCTAACESWCAPCNPNALIPNSNLPTDPANITNPVLCSKTITSTTPCAASCVWSGKVNNDSSPGYARCP